MAHQSTIVENGMTYNVTEFDHTAQEIDDAVSNLGGSSTPQGAIAALGAGVRPNLLVNPFFKVNQRGNSTYTSNGYCVDNWKITCKDTGNYGVTVHDDYITISAGQNLETRVDQFIEDADAVLGKTVTCSALLEDGTFRTGSAVFQKSSGGYQTETIYSDSTFQLLLQSGPSMNALVRLVAKEGKSVGVRAVKLELGDIQTLAYQDSSGTWNLLEQPDPLELLKCQRYFYYAKNILCPGQIKNSNIYLTMYLPTKMRVIPSMTVKSYGTIINNGVSNVPTTFDSLLLSGNILHFRTNAPANTANYTPCVLTDLNAEISAEL